MPANIAELERRAGRLLTPEVYDYYADDVRREQTLRAHVRGAARAGAHAYRHRGGDGTHDSA